MHAKKMAQREKPTTATKDASRMKFVRRAIESANEYNVFLNRQRRLERPVYMDQQTDTVNYPVGLGRQNKTLTRTNKIGRFPVAVIPSQYQDWYVEYTPQELEFLPVDTVLKGPIMSIDKLPPVLTTPDVSDFESDSSDGEQNNEDSDQDNEAASSSSDECSTCCSCCADNNKGADNNITTNGTNNVNETSMQSTNANDTRVYANHHNNNNSSTT